MSSTALASITPDIVKEHGLTPEEYQRILGIMGRVPNLVELGIFSVMWSEHCSYKTTRKHLRMLPTEAPWVICGPGENAGVIDIGDGQAAIFKMESHNHPSFIEPFQGAATGVGGILRDVFTMGARPIANLNALRFGAPEHPKTRHLLAGVVAGIGAYGNCVGVPTVGGECTFHPSYNGNILVNAMTVGIAATDKIFYSKAAGVGNKVVYLGSKTGRDGIHGATMASAEFSAGSEEKRPTVQVGDPFTEKLLIEACLELMATGAVIAIQDMGAAGLTSSSLEMAGKGGLGMRMDLDQVPVREHGMTPYEIMLSESQERMLLIIAPEKTHVAEAIFKKWDLDCATIGELTQTGTLELFMHGEKVAELPIAPISVDAPVYDRPFFLPEKKSDDGCWMVDIGENKDVQHLASSLQHLLRSPDISSKRWIWEQYDHMVGNDTVARPGGDAAVVRVHGTQKALALTTDCTPRYCAADPVEGGKQAVVESWRNLIAVGARPLAITNCLNFGNPEKPEVMGQIIGCLQGMREACLALHYPVVSGNVSLYNDTEGNSVQPTPAIGGVGLLTEVNMHIGSGVTQAGQSLLLLGDTRGHLGQSLYMREVHGREEGTPPPVDLLAEKRHGECVQALIAEGRVSACHDVSDGGLLVAIAEMCIAGGMGLVLESDLRADVAFWFGEDQARYVLATVDAPVVMDRARAAGVPCTLLGVTGGDSVILSGQCTLSLAMLRATHARWLPEYMA